LDRGTNCFLIIYTLLPPIKYSEILSSVDAYNDPFLINIEELTGIHRFDLSLMLKDAYEKADYIFDL